MQARFLTRRWNHQGGSPFLFRQEPTHEQCLPARPEEPRSRPETAPIELDDDLTRRDAWMFLPLAAIVIALPILATAMFGFSAWDLASRDEASRSPPETFAMRWPEQSLPVLR